MTSAATPPKIFRLTIGGKISRDLPIVTFPSGNQVASFVMLGDTELNETCAELLHARITQELEARKTSFDAIVGMEAKAIGLLQELARRFGQRYVVLRKSVKNYMQDPVSVAHTSITSQGEQHLVLNGPDADFIRGKNVLLVDDVVATGGTVQAARELMEVAGARVVLMASVLLKDPFPDIPDHIYLERPPM